MRNLILLFLAIFSYAFADSQASVPQQPYTIKGNVYNTQTGEPVMNASITVEGSQTGSSTGINGDFEIRLPSGRYNISVTSLGYSERIFSLRVPSGNMENLSIGLYPENLYIEGVDIIGDLYLREGGNILQREPVSLWPSITRINAIEIERQGAVTLTDAFKFVPGGWIETRGRKTKQFFSVRGQRYPYPDYSINGIWQKEFEETVYFFSALDVESVEIVRSSNALVKGLSGLTGVVDVTTKRPVKETISLTAKYGKLNNYVTNLQYGNKTDAVTVNTSASFFGTDGPPGRRGKERIANFHGHMDWEVTSNTELTAGATYIQGLREFVSIVEPGSPMLMNREESFDPVRTLLSYIKLNRKGNDGSLTEIQTNLAYRNSDYTSYDIAQETTSDHQEKDYEYGLNILHSRLLTTSNTLRFGLLYNHAVAPEGKRYYAGRRSDLHTWSGVVASEQRLGKFVFDAGFRIIGGYISEFGGFGIEGSAAGFRQVEPIMDQFAPVEWQSALGASWILATSTTLHYNFTGGTVSPRRGSLSEEGTLPGNEARFQHDLGLRYRCIAGNEFLLSTFFNKRNNAIQLSGETVVTENGLIMELYENLDKRNYGLEMSTKLNMPSLYSFLFANSTFMWGQDDINGELVKDEKIPGYILNLGVMFEHSGFDLNFYINYTGSYVNNRFVRGPWIQEHGDFPLGDFVSADITAGYTLSRQFSARFFFEVKNILDQKYLTVAGYPDFGRLISSGLRIDI